MNQPNNQPDFLPNIHKWASLIIAAVYSETGEFLGFVFVFDPNKNDPRHKLPGGRKKPIHIDKNSPSETARREMGEETGLWFPLEIFKEFTEIREWRTFPEKHWLFTYIIKVKESEIIGMNSDEPGNEDEIPGYYTLAQTKKLVKNDKFLSVHYKKILAAVKLKLL